jgi:hypothetical protein
MSPCCFDPNFVTQLSRDEREMSVHPVDFDERNIQIITRDSFRLQSRFQQIRFVAIFEVVVDDRICAKYWNWVTVESCRAHKHVPKKSGVGQLLFGQDRTIGID